MDSPTLETRIESALTECRTAYTIAVSEVAPLLAECLQELKRRDEIVTAVRERCLEFETSRAQSDNMTDEERGFFEGHTLAHQQMHTLTYEVERAFEVRDGWGSSS